MTNMCLSAKNTIGPNFASHFTDLLRERVELVYYSINSNIERQYLTLGLSFNLSAKVPLRNRGRNLCNFAYLYSKIHSYIIHVLSKIFPSTLDALYSSLSAEPALRPDFPGNLGHLICELLKLINYEINHTLQLQNFALTLRFNLSYQIPLYNSSHYPSDVSNLRSEIMSYGVHIHYQFALYALYTVNLSLAAEFALGTDLPGNLRNSGCKGP